MRSPGLFGNNANVSRLVTKAEAIERAMKQATNSSHKEELVTNKNFEENRRKNPAFFDTRATQTTNNMPVANVLSRLGAFPAPKPMSNTAAISKKDLLKKLSEAPTPDPDNVRRLTF